jgi:hypothetical protein
MDGRRAFSPEKIFPRPHKRPSFTMTPTQLPCARAALDTFLIETPVWGAADTGSRFGRFFGTPERST